MLARLDAAVDEATVAFDGFDYARALERTEEFFWWFCDDYVELVKSRAYGYAGDDGRGIGARPRCASRSTRSSGCSRRSCRSWPRRCGAGGTTTSVHAAGVADAARRPTPTLSLDAASEVLARVRRAKTEAKVSQRAAVARLAVRRPARVARRASTPARADLVEALTVDDARPRPRRHGVASGRAGRRLTQR